MKKNALIIFAKNPILGRMKTRLAASIGEKKTLEIYLQMLDIVFEYTKDLRTRKIIFWQGGIPSRSIFSNGEYEDQEQLGFDLGESMCNAFKMIFQSSEKVCIIGTDCVELTFDILERAFLELETGIDVVIGPAVDGGYYLLGLKKHSPEFFQKIEWSSSSVYSETYRIATELSFSKFILPTLSDIDRLEDYLLMKRKKFIL